MWKLLVDASQIFCKHYAWLAVMCGPSLVFLWCVKQLLDSWADSHGWLCHLFFINSIDASRVFGRVGRAVNDSAPPNCNCQMKKICIKGSAHPYLALFATRLILRGEEIVYDYGDAYLPWRREVIQHIQWKKLKCLA